MVSGPESSEINHFRQPSLKMKISTSLLIPTACTLFMAVIYQCSLCSGANQTVPKKGKILTFGVDEEDQDLLEARAGNKSHKILTRPLLPTTTAATPYNPYFMYPYSPGFTVDDSSAQASGLQGSVQQAPINNQNDRMQQTSGNKEAGVPDIYVQLIGAIEKLVGRMDKLDNRLRTVENIIYHMTNKKQELPEQG